LRSFIRDMKNLKTTPKKLFTVLEKNPATTLGVFFSILMLLPAAGFCDINSAFSETKIQVESIVSNRSGLFWIFMVIILGSAIWALFKGSWKMLGIALLIGVILGNFPDVIDTVLTTKIFNQ